MYRGIMCNVQHEQQGAELSHFLRLQKLLMGVVLATLAVNMIV